MKTKRRLPRYVVKEQLRTPSARLLCRPVKYKIIDLSTGKTFIRNIKDLRKAIDKKKRLNEIEWRIEEIDEHIKRIEMQKVRNEAPPRVFWLASTYGTLVHRLRCVLQRFRRRDGGPESPQAT